VRLVGKRFPGFGRKRWIDLSVNSRQYHGEMTSVQDLENEEASARLIEQADGVLLFAYPGVTGGCGPQLIALLEELSGSLPVLIVQPEISDDSDATAFEVNGSKVELIPSNPGQAQNAAVMSAMRSLTIKAPILILLNPLFIPFWERAFGAYRWFAVTEEFRSGVAKLKSKDEDFERQKRCLILLFERCVHGILNEEDDDLEWMRNEFVYRGDSLQVKEFRGNAGSSFLDLSQEALLAASRFPHRLDILILVGEPKEGGGLPVDSVVGRYKSTSRHNVYLALMYSETESISETPDYGDFDVLIIDQSVKGEVDPAVADGIRAFRGIKGVMVGAEQIAGLDLCGDSFECGAHIVANAGGLNSDEKGALDLDFLLSSLMPGLPNWQIHQAGKYLSHQAWTLGQLVEKHADGEFDGKLNTDPLEELRLLEKQKMEIEEELDVMREVIASKDQMILELEKKAKTLRDKPTEKTKGGILRGLLYKIKGR